MRYCFVRLRHGAVHAAVLFVLLAVGAACRGAPASIAPAGLAPIEIESVLAWTDSLSLERARLYELRWQFRNAQGAAGGRAAIRVAPPDSLRFDFRGPFGRSGAAVVVGDSGVWARPEDQFGDILRTAPLLWAALGLPLDPPPAAAVAGLQRPGLRAWRYAVQSDTFDFVHITTGDPRLLAEMRRGGRIVAVSESRLRAPWGAVSAARLDFPPAESRFSFEVQSVDSTVALDPGIWQRP